MKIGGNSGPRPSMRVGAPTNNVTRPVAHNQNNGSGGLGALGKIGGDVVKNMANSRMNAAATTGQALVGAVRRGIGSDPQARDAGARAVDAGVDKLTRNWPEDRKEALTRTLDTLHRMAGADGKFNHGDVAGIRADATRKLGALGRAGAGGVIERNLNKTLNELGVDPATKDPADAADKRGLTTGALKELKNDIETLKEAFGGDRSALGDFLKKHIDVGDKPLAGGVPSPKDPLAVLETALQVIANARIK